MMDKYELIDTIITGMDELADARGVKRCALTVSIIQKLSELKKIMQAEDRQEKTEG